MTDNIQKVFNDVFRHSVGMERLFDASRNISGVANRVNSNFPAYNIRKTSENDYQIEIAIAGYSIDDIRVELEKNTLTITSDGHSLGEEAKDFLYQGFTYKGFKRVFTLDADVKVVDAELSNGILRVHLERIVPEEQKPKLIEIRSSETKKERSLLTEDR